MQQQITLEDLQEMLAKAKGNPKKLTEMEGLLNRILEQDPDAWVVQFYLSVLWMHTDRAHLAVPLLKQCAIQQPEVPEIWNNLGTAYRRCAGAFNEQAEEALSRALELNPKDADILNNLGTLHVNEGTPEIGEKYLRQALKHNPKHYQAKWNMGLCQLEQEKWVSGFKNYTFGLLSGDRTPKTYGKAVWWDGGKHPNKTLVITGEQGIGDEILFASCIRDIQSRFGGEIVLDAHPRLAGMMQRSFPDIHVYPTRKELNYNNYKYWVEQHKPEYRVMIGDLPKFCRHSEADFPRVAYIKPDPVRVAEYEEWIDLLGEGPYIGMSWVGGHKTTRKDLRAIKLDDWKPILDAVDGKVISCQYTSNNREAEEAGIQTFPEVFEMTKWDCYRVVKDGNYIAEAPTKELAKHHAAIYGGDVKHITGPAHDYDETAAFVQAIVNKGGVICSVNTSLVHLCGAMGLPCLTLTPAKPAWRYNLSREDMIWYPQNSVRQYRQERTGEWSTAIANLADDLEHYLKKKEVKIA